MKAVIMAGGEGTRLRPLTLDRPKPMIPLFGKPVMEHIIGLLKRHGFTDICVTLQYMPQVVTEWFGDGAELGVKLTYFVEKEPLGTAGSVKNCMAHLGARTSWSSAATRCATWTCPPPWGSTAPAGRRPP